MCRRLYGHIRIWPFVPRPFYNLRNRLHYWIREHQFHWYQKRGKPFPEKHLIFAAYARCNCGAGLAYHPGIGMRGFWDCSAVLTGKVTDPYEKGPDGNYIHASYPFMFYSIKSECQPSANGRTTRPRNAGIKS